jgi:LmbE family N-acetylglucosaminyl deacetylase
MTEKSGFLQESRHYDVLAIGAHPDDLEAVMGGTTLLLTRAGRSVLFVDLCDGEPARYAPRGARTQQALEAARLLGVDRHTLPFQDRMLQDTEEARFAVARLIRLHTPQLVFTTLGSGIHPDHKAVSDIVTHAAFYARLPKWEEIPAASVLNGTLPHEIGRLFFGHCRMEPAWERFDFAIDVSSVYTTKLAALGVYEAVFSGPQSALLDRYRAEDRYIGSLVNVEYAESFRARSPLLVQTPEVFLNARFG